MIFFVSIGLGGIRNLCITIHHLSTPLLQATGLRNASLRARTALQQCISTRQVVGGLYRCAIIKVVDDLCVIAKFTNREWTFCPSNKTHQYRFLSEPGLMCTLVPARKGSPSRPTVCYISTGSWTGVSTLVRQPHQCRLLSRPGTNVATLVPAPARNRY